jgi:glycosyltransferase involved in cell wall biosynthesis
MKILQIIQRRQLRGAEIFACQLGVELQVIGHEVHVAYLFDSHDELDFPLKFIPIGANESRRLRDLRGYSRLAKLVKENQYDIVQANAGDTLKYAVVSKLLYRYQTTIVFRNANVLGKFIKGTAHGWYVKWLLSGCDSYISVSENCRLDLLRITGVHPSRAVTIPIGTYDFSSLPAVSVDDKTTKPIIVHVASFVKEKNHRFLIDVFKRYIELGGTGTLWLVGAGPLTNDVKSYAQSLGTDSRIVFWGARRNAVEIVKAADIFILPSLIEGMPGVILEALSCGVPVVCSSVGGTSEIVSTGVNGICLEGYSVDQYVATVNRLISDKQYAQQIAAAGRRTVAGGYLMSGIARRFEARYNELLSKGI